MIQIALLQLNATVGDLTGNGDRVLQAYRRAVTDGADLVVAPELFLTGYPPEDLLLLPAFLDDVDTRLNSLAKATTVPLIVGAPWRDRKRVKNAAFVLRDGEIEAIAGKNKLPNYGPFDEERYFAKQTQPTTIDVAGTCVGITICEDLWSKSGPHKKLAQQGAELLVNLSASPFHLDKQALRQEIFAQRARECGLPIAVCNLVGGQDELVFDGQSFCLDRDGNCIAQAPGFVETTLMVNTDTDASEPETPSAMQQLADALCLGIRDYADKNGFAGVLIGMSGGIDSALTGALAVRALGRDRVHAISMPSRYNSEDTRSDARAICSNLEIDFREISIEQIFQATLDTLTPHLGDPEDWGVTAENMQSRSRGQILMSLSNRYGWLVLATGNKSELAMGYATLYGDMVGGFAAIKDLTKTRVFELTRWLIETEGMAIPETILTRPPSAELREQQADTDSLPPYDVLDPILDAYIEDNLHIDDIVTMGVDRALAARVLRAVDRSEYKRRQGAPGPRVTQRIFGKDRRMPITQAWERH